MSSGGRASIELVSESGPIDFSVMMQEGVKALTKILSDHLQDNPDFIKQQSMKFIFKDEDGKIQPFLETDNKTVNSQHNVETEKLTESNTQSNYRIYSKCTESSDIQLDIDCINNTKEICSKSMDRVKENNGLEVASCSDIKVLQDDIDDIELPSSDTEGNFLFDYAPRDMSGIPKNQAADGIAHIFENIKSQNFSHKEERINSVKESHKQWKPLHSDTDTELHGMDEISRDSYCNHHHHYNHEYSDHDHSCTQIQPNEYQYKYNPKSKPDFQVLSLYDSKTQPLCLFCEYYLVFGEAPKNMIKWYNKYGSLTTSTTDISTRKNTKKKKKKGKRGKR